MKYPRISIVIPSYNKVKFIKETLDSIVSQKYPNLEVIIQDGGSTDGTLDIIKKYCKDYPKIFSFVSRRDKGQTDVINKGLKKATGEIFTYINADDVYAKGALLSVGKVFSKKPDTLWLAGRGKVIDAKGQEIAKLITWYKNFLLTINHYSLLLVVNYLMQPSVFLSRKAYKKFGQFVGWEKGVLEYGLWLKLAKHRMPVTVNETLSNFRLVRNSTSVFYLNLISREEIRLMRKYSKNTVLLFFHWLHNQMRKLLVSFILETENDLDDPVTSEQRMQLIKEKRLLYKLYIKFYKDLLSVVPGHIGGKIVELGSGGGFLKELEPKTITSDILPIRGVDMVMDAEKMPFKNSEVKAFVGLNVLHHIKNPKKAFLEMERCLKKGGAISFIEPSNTFWSRFIYKNFHHEFFDESAGWEREGKGGPLSEANIALPWIMFVRDRSVFEKEFPLLRIEMLKIHTPFLYLASGGLSKWQLVPDIAYGLVRTMDRLLSNQGMFVHITIRRK